MLLVIDSGNTNIVFALFKGDEVIGRWRFASNPKYTADEYAIVFLQFLQLNGYDFSDINHVVISNVVPQTSFALEQFCQSYLSVAPMVVGDDAVSLGMEIKVPRAKEVGADRLVNTVAAYHKFGGDTVVIDFGTATNFDVIDSKGNYCGGVIAPGVNASIKALHIAAAKLPEIEVARPDTVIGTDTVGAMQSGVFWGYVSLIEGMLERIEKEYGRSMTVVATGGLAALFSNAMTQINHYEPDLTVWGLKEIYRRNK